MAKEPKKTAPVAAERTDVVKAAIAAYSSADAAKSTDEYLETTRDWFEAMAIEDDARKKEEAPR